MTRRAPRGAVAALCAALAASCSDAAGPPDAGVEDAALPPIVWGAASSAYQIEGGNHACDWRQFELQGKIADATSADDGPDALHRYREDLALAASIGLKAYRLSLEWSRLEPVHGRYDPAALAYYHDVLAACREHGLAPMVTLSHFTLPLWAHDTVQPQNSLGGWAGQGEPVGQGALVAEFTRFARDMAAEFGADVDLWNTLNEPMVQVVGTYVAIDQFPHAADESPFKSSRARDAAANMVWAHARAYDAIHAADLADADGDGDPAQVALAAHLRGFIPYDASRADAVAATPKVESLFNWWFLDAVTRGDLDLDFDTTLTSAGDLTGAPELKGRLDFVGVNYYSRSKVYPVEVTEGDVTIPGLAGENDDPAVPHSDLGWEINAEVFHDLLVKVARDYRLPIWVTENGIADAADSRRAGFIVEHVEALQRARRDGADVRGYLHWSLTDNFEWAQGLAPRFGLFGVDYATQRRHKTRGAEAYEAIIRAGGVTPDITLAYGGGR